jgi:hypothetical protein
MSNEIATDINNERAARGLGALSTDQNLTTLAQQEAATPATNDGSGSGPYTYEQTQNYFWFSYVGGSAASDTVPSGYFVNQWMTDPAGSPYIVGPVAPQTLTATYVPQSIGVAVSCGANGQEGVEVVVGSLRSANPVGGVNPNTPLGSVTSPTAGTSCSAADTTYVVNPGPLTAIYQQPYSTTLQAGGGTPPYAWALAAGQVLPPGLTMSTAGVISGTPTTLGTTNFGVVATDSTGQAGSALITITVQETHPLAITTTGNLPVVFVGDGYNQQLQSSGGTAPITWSLAPGSTAPPGLQLSTSGVLSGTPTQPGSFNFTVQAVDSLGDKATQPLVFTAQLHNPPPNQGTLGGGVVGMASIPNGTGYWLVNYAGVVSPHGNAVQYGGTANG